MQMTREMQKWLRDFVRTEFPDLVAKSVFYYQAGGIKFWALSPDNRSSGLLTSKIKAHLLAKAPTIARTTCVYIGVVPGTHVAVLKILDQDARDPKLEPFRRRDFQPQKPAVFDHSGFGEDPAHLRIRTKMLKDAALESKNPTQIKVLLMEKLNTWKTNLDRLDNQHGNVPAAEVKAIAADIQMTRLKLQNLAW